jgi:hypothetical protein
MTMSQTKIEFDRNLALLIDAVERQNKKLILFYYDKINFLDFEELSDFDLDTYDEIVERGNEIIYQ